jgi:Asp-tRNA(Asn)/Glu-tRNA(Gln) amidotransferase A subunit family amidase
MPKTSLKTLSSLLRSGELPLHAYLLDALHDVSTLDAGIHSLVPEPRREQRLLQEADELLKRYPLPGERPPLFGVLIGIKDLFNVDGLPTRAGSRLPPQAFSGAQSSIVSKLKEAGCLVLGKTVSTEFAYFSPGPTRNPVNPRHTPGGSSSGSAAVVALGLCPLALGTQTIASVSRPAAYCGVFGFKPSQGRISIEGVFPFAQSVDQIGYFAASFDDLAFAAPFMVQDWQSPAASKLNRVLIPDGAYLKQADAKSLEHFDTSLEALSRIGWELIYDDLFSDIEQINAKHQSLIAAEFALNHRLLSARFGDLYSEQSQALIKLGQSVSSSELASLRKLPMLLRSRIATRMRELSCALILSPGATSTAPSGLESTGSPLMSLPFTQAGLPTLAIPNGQDSKGLPYSLQIAAAYREDEFLLHAGCTLSALPCF